MFENIEIHCLICSKDMLLALHNFQSLLLFEEFNKMPIFFHDDGSLTNDDYEILKDIPNSTIIPRDVADKEIKQFIINFPFSSKYRLENNHIHLWHKIKLFDYFYFSKTKKIIGMDTDLLFMRRPSDVINHLINDSPFYFPDVQNAYCFNEPKDEIKVLNNVNTGLIYIPSEEYYNADAIEFALANLLKGGVNYFPSWIEQSAFAHMFYADRRYKPLGAEEYRIPYFQTIDSLKVECLHFVSYHKVRELYPEYLKLLKIDDYYPIYVNDFIINFENEKIPLNLAVKKNESGDLIFEYRWELDKTNQKHLDHIFEIHDGDSIKQFKFQSEKNGFFIIKPSTNMLHVYHTYDWFGKMNWKNLDGIQI